MNIENKKTALEDDAALYQKRGESVSQEELKNLSSKQKFQYFKDYYLLKIVIAVAAIAVVANIAYTTIFNKKENVLAVGVLGGAYITETAAMEDSIREALQIESEDQLVTVGNYDLTQSAQNMAYVARLSSHDLDIILCDQEYFDAQCQFGHFLTLEEFLTPELLEKYQDRFVMGKVAIQDENGEITGYEEEKPYGILVSDSPFYKEFGEYSDTAIIAFPVSTERFEMIYEFLNSPLMSD